MSFSLGTRVSALAVAVLFAWSLELSATDKPKAKKAAHARAATVRGRTVRGKGRGRLAAPAPSYQLHPDPERYQQIQQSLADRGYFKGTVNGQWGDDSADAVRRFQVDRKIDPDGKINALTLGGLGLGPQHGSAANTAGTHAPPTPAPVPVQTIPTPVPAISTLPNGTVVPPTT